MLSWLSLFYAIVKIIYLKLIDILKISVFINLLNMLLILVNFNRNKIILKCMMGRKNGGAHGKQSERNLCQKVGS